MIVLGLDPAIRTTGYGVINVSGPGRFEILDCGVIKNGVKLTHSECLRRLYGGVEQLVKTFAPVSAAIEEPFVGRNAGTAIILGMARGAIVSCLANHEIECYSYSPASAKRSAVGRGGATKDQVAMMIAAELGIDVANIPLDSSDALAIAICHAQKIQTLTHTAGRKV